MQATPFNASQDLEPIPFSRELCLLAQKMKEAGLSFRPHVGCFVWDRENRIPAPSPFPHDIYFILNVNHFTRIFGDTEEMSRSLIWLPTFTQCLQLTERLPVNSDAIRKSLTRADGDLVTLYRVFLEELRT
jgi:hypothetical protein